MNGNKIKVIRTDNGNYNIKNKLWYLCHENSIHMQQFVPYTPQQNGVAKRKNRALKEMNTCMMEAKYLSPKIWDEAINCDEYVQNIFSHK